MELLTTSPYLAENTLETKPGVHTIYHFLTNRTETVDELSFAMLERCLTPTSRRTLLQEYGSSRLLPLLEGKLLLDSEQVWQAHEVRIVEIEIGTQCNWRCEYCPRKEHPAPPAVMPMDLFRDIIRKAVSYTHLTLPTN